MGKKYIRTKTRICIYLREKYNTKYTCVCVCDVWYAYTRVQHDACVSLSAVVCTRWWTINRFAKMENGGNTGAGEGGSKWKRKRQKPKRKLKNDAENKKNAPRPPRTYDARSLRQHLRAAHRRACRCGGAPHARTEDRIAVARVVAIATAVIAIVAAAAAAVVVAVVARKRSGRSVARASPRQCVSRTLRSCVRPLEIRVRSFPSVPSVCRRACRRPVSVRA